MKVKPKKSFGQHFLTDLSVAQRIADTVDARPDLPILEIGPGTGVLTRPLLAKLDSEGRPRPLVAVEIDRESIAYLRSQMPALHVEEADFLQADLAPLFGGAPFVLTGNYPYNISSQIFFRLVEMRERIPLCTGMIQREVAQRLAAPCGNRTYGVLSIFVQLWYDVDYLFTVPPSVFNPPPKVQSAVVALRRNARQRLDCDERLFRRVVKTAFSMRRKMLRSPMRQLLGKDSPLLAAPFFNQRPEQLSIDDYIALTQRLAEAIETHDAQS